jgi:single-strand DNA-binding protein
MYNKVILMGRICHDLELKTTPNGVPVLSFRMAVERGYQPKGEERKADFFSIVAWRNVAEFISRYFYKGRMILIEGELQTRQYTDKNNTARDVVEIIVENARFTGEPKQQPQGDSYNQGNYQNNQNQSGQNSQSQQTAAPAQSQQFAEGQDYVAGPYDDDYPF